MCCYNTALGQSYYQFSADSGVYSNIVGANSINDGTLWDDENVRVPIGFDFKFFDQTFDSVSISDYLRFTTAGNYWIDAYSADFIDRGPVVSSSPRSYKTEGAVGNRIFKVEWNNAGFYCEKSDLGTTNDFINVQVWLYEDSNRVEIRYGASVITDPVITFCGDEGADIGLKTTFSKAAVVNSVSNPVLSTIATPITGIPNEGIIYKFRKCLIPSTQFSVTHDSLGNYQFIIDTLINVSSYLWNFGDGTTDTSKNPLHHFNFNNQYAVSLTIYGECGLIITSSYSVVTGIYQDKVSSYASLKIYPNPTENYLYVEHNTEKDKRITVELYNLLGKQIDSFTFSNKIRIDLTQYPSGSYFILGSTNRQIYFKKFIKR